jgi:hypothetical protein
MQIKSSTIIWLIVGFLWSIFMGVTAVSMGFGSVFPSLNYIAKPFVCPAGQMALEENVSHPLPGTTYTILHWYCVDARSGAKTELNPFAINLCAGPLYGVLIFVMVLIIWYFYSHWDPDKATAEAKKRVAWIQTGVVILVVVGLTLFNLVPLIRSMTATPIPTSEPDATATALALTFQALTSGTPVAFDSVEKPLANWKGVPVMPQATAGQQVDQQTYAFRVPVDSGTVESFYHDQLKSLGWDLADEKFLGMIFTKDKSTLWVTLAPDADLQSWVVTLILMP